VAVVGELTRPPAGDFNKRGLRLERLLVDLVSRTARAGVYDDDGVQEVAQVAYRAVREIIVREIDERGMALMSPRMFDLPESEG
jgi:hypothetical protein